MDQIWPMGNDIQSRERFYTSTTEVLCGLIMTKFGLKGDNICFTQMMSTDTQMDRLMVHSSVPA